MNNDKHTMWEGLGGPVHMNRPDFTGIDPTLEDCCRQEEEMKQVRRVVETSLRRHDVAALAERRRRHLVRNEYFEGCRCGYDPERDGGDYRALIEYRQQKQKELTREENEKEEKGDNDDKELSENDKQQQQQQQQQTNSYYDQDDHREREQQHHDKNNDNNNEDEDDDEFDYLLDEDLPDSAGNSDLKDLEDRRRAELEWIILHQETAKHHGYGVLRQLHPTRALKAAGLVSTTTSRSAIVPPPAAAVLHLVDPDSWTSASLDDYLEQTVAPLARGTMFVRSGGRSTLLLDAETIARIHGGRDLLQRLDPEHDMPALVAIRDGSIVNVCPKLQGLTDVNSRNNERVIVPEAVYEWLDRSGVLLPHPPPMELLCAIRPEEEALLDNMRAYSQASREPPQATFFRCGVPDCQKTYPHEHVGVQTTEQDGHVLSEEDVLGSTTLTARK